MSADTAVTTARPGWREEQRQDRLLRAQIDRERDESRARARVAEREAAARVRLEAAAARRDARAATAAARRVRLAAVAGWAAGHVVELLFVPVIAVPGLLSWSAMSAFGAALYGPIGYALPAFSEGAMWAFAAAVTLTLHRHPGRPVWHLRAGIVVFAAFGAGLNYVHGLTVPPFPGLPPGPVTGGIMAAVSVAGVTAHQLVTAFGDDAGRGVPRPDEIRTEIDDVREAVESHVRALGERLDATAASLADAARGAQAAFRTETGAVREALRTETAAVRAAVRTEIGAVRERHDAAAAALADTITGTQAAFRAEIEAVREALAAPVPVPAAGNPPAPDRAALVTELADQIRDAISSGDQWTPDYPALMERTGYRRSWCEKAVRDARNEAFSAPHHAPESQPPARAAA